MASGAPLKGQLVNRHPRDREGSIQIDSEREGESERVKEEERMEGQRQFYFKSFLDFAKKANSSLPSLKRTIVRVLRRTSGQITSDNTLFRVALLFSSFFSAMK